jgi:hypothetical protein
MHLKCKLWLPDALSRQINDGFARKFRDGYAINELKAVCCAEFSSEKI